EDRGFSSLAQAPPFRVIADYLFPGVQNEVVATMLAGVMGTLVVFGAAYGLARLLKSRKEPVR
ncbi:MAG: PDGLE domain-containing protein, partial [Chloroflexota bacterium]|nr:PDGLE domain-containing protein [Chloroflexota bacterium]